MLSLSRIIRGCRRPLSLAACPAVSSPLPSSFWLRCASTITGKAGGAAAAWSASIITSRLGIVPAVTGSTSSTGVNCARLLPQLQVRYRSGRSRRGLYDGKDVGTGNRVSFSKKSTKRKFKPNVHIKRVYSETLDEMIRFHVTTSALRSIDKAGGLDNYLLKRDDIIEGEGYRAKRRILKRIKDQKRWDRKQQKLKQQQQQQEQQDQSQEAAGTAEKQLEGVSNPERE